MRLALYAALGAVLALVPAEGLGQRLAPSVLAHAVAKGERIEAGDFEAAAETAIVPADALAPEQAAGMEAARNLAAGMVVRRGDVLSPRLVRRGEPVVVRYVSGGLTIASGGRALVSAGAGDVARVVVTSTNRTLDAVVVGPGEVRVVGP